MNNVLMISVIISLGLISQRLPAGVFEIKQIVEDEAPLTWTTNAGFYVSLQALTVQETSRVLPNTNGKFGEIRAEEIENLADLILASKHLIKYILQFSDAKALKAITINYISLIIRKNGGRIMEGEPQDEMIDESNDMIDEPEDGDLIPDELTSQEKFLARLLWTERPRKDVAETYQRKFNINSINTAYGHISFLYNKVPGLREHRRSLNPKRLK